MSKKNIPLHEGKNYIIFDGDEDLSALPRQQRRLRERLREKERQRIIRREKRGLVTPDEAS